MQQTNKRESCAEYIEGSIGGAARIIFMIKAACDDASPKGCLSAHSSLSSTPRAHMSAFSLYGSPLQSSGERYPGEPTRVCAISREELSCLDTPKSPILTISPSPKKML
eukprot:scaffold93526_cov33-Tisochrysis_lutea.AAC.2